MFGDGSFGELAFAEPRGVRGRVGPGGASRGIGGSGFPDNWAEIIAANAADDERRRRHLELEAEAAELILAGLL